MKPRCSIVAIILVAVAGCSQDAPGKRTAATASWSATAALVAREWLAGSAPALYAEDAIRNANTEIGTLQISETARVASAHLLEAVRAGDRTLASRQAQILDDEAKALRSPRP